MVRPWPATSFILPRQFFKLRDALRQDLVHDQNLVCAPPGLQSPAGLPAAAYDLHRPRCRALRANLRLHLLQATQPSVSRLGP